METLLLKQERIIKNNLNDARSCYDHLAGINGVYMLEKMLELKWLEIKDDKKPLYKLTDSGKIELQKRNVKIPVEFKGKRIFAYGCMDWTVKRNHLGGSLGAAMFKTLMESGYIKKASNSRKVIVLQDLKYFFGKS